MSETLSVAEGLVTLLAFVGMVALASAAVAFAERRGWLDDSPLPWEDTPGYRNDRRRLLEDEVR